MVGPGEVDEDLEPETAEECSKYGEVEKCVIFEVILVTAAGGICYCNESHLVITQCRGYYGL